MSAPAAATQTVPRVGRRALLAALGGGRSSAAPPRTARRLRGTRDQDAPASGEDRGVGGTEEPGPADPTGARAAAEEAPANEATTGGDKTGVDIGSRTGGGPRSALKPGSAARARRRRVEAELIGLPAGSDPEWWEPCWERGVDGGLAPDRLFDALAAFHPGVRVLHRLGVAGTVDVIDHVVVGPGGVVVAGTTSCPGRVRSDGVHLRVRGRDRSPLIDVALWRAEVVRTTLGRRGIRDVPVHGVVHWQHLEGLGDRAIALRGVPLLSAGAAIGMAARGVDLSPLTIERVVTALTPSSVAH